MAFTRKSLAGLARSFLPDVGAALRRFPLAAFIAIVFTALNLFEAKKALGLDGDAWMRLSFGLGASFLWSFAVALFAQSRGWPNGTRFAAALSGIAAIAALHAVPITLSFQPQLFFVGLTILVGLAPYLRGSSSQNASFWRFNHHLWLGSGIALFGAVLFSGGLSVIVETLELLFELKFPEDTHQNIWTVGLGLIAPLNWLSLTSANFSEQVPEGDQQEFTSQAVAVIVKYILVPLLLVYTAILYAYAAKIALDGVLPKGRIGPMVLGYGLLGTLTVLFSWPSRKAGGPLVALFWRHWFWLTLGPAALLFLAAYKRIAQYGVTVDRYLVVLAGIWLCGMAIWFLVRRGARDIRIIPLSFCAVLIMASLGPWGAVGWAVRDQKFELVSLLEANGRMKDGQLILTGDNKPLPNDEARRARSVLLYLQRHNRLEDLKSWFANEKDNPFADDVAQYKISRKIERLIGVPKQLRPWRKPEYFHFAVKRQTFMPLSGFDEIIGPVWINWSKSKNTLISEDRRLFDVGVKNNIISFSFPFGQKWTFDVSDAARRAAELSVRRHHPKNEKDPRVPLKVLAQNDAGSVMLIVKMRGKAGKVGAGIQSMKVWLLLKTK